MIKAAWLDVETTGLNPTSNGLIQLACIIKDAKYCMNIRPFEKDFIDDAALKVNKLTKEQLAEFEPPVKAYRDFTKFLQQFVNPFDKQDKLLFFAYNARFDMDFIREWFLKCGDKYFGSYFWFPPIDVMNVAADKLKEERDKLKDFKLVTVAKYLGISFDEGAAHDALFDIELTQEVYSKLNGGNVC